MNVKITKSFQFNSSHRLVNNDLTERKNKEVFGKCFNYPSHGHLYTLFITVSSLDSNLRNGMIINFTKLKEIVNKNVIDIFDHNFINDLKCMKGKITTCENMVFIIWKLLEKRLLAEGVVLEEIKLYETPTSYATLTK